MYIETVSSICKFTLWLEAIKQMIVLLFVCWRPELTFMLDQANQDYSQPSWSPALARTPALLWEILVLTSSVAVCSAGALYLKAPTLISSLSSASCSRWPGVLGPAEERAAGSGHREGPGPPVGRPPPAAIHSSQEEPFQCKHSSLAAHRPLEWQHTNRWSYMVRACERVCATDGRNGLLRETRVWLRVPRPAQVVNTTAFSQTVAQISPARLFVLTTKQTLLRRRPLIKDLFLPVASLISCLCVSSLAQYSLSTKRALPEEDGNTVSPYSLSPVSSNRL